MDELTEDEGYNEAMENSHNSRNTGRSFKEPNTKRVVAVIDPMVFRLTRPNCFI